MWYMNKSEVYSWRLSPDLKAALEEAARSERTSLSRLLASISREWLRQRSGTSEEEQNRVRKAARKCLGTIRGGDPYLAEQAGERARQSIRKRYASKRAD